MWTLLVLCSLISTHAVQGADRFYTTDSYGTDATEVSVAATTVPPTCRYNCGRHMGSCSCTSSCQYYGNCCYGYNYYCQSTTQSPDVTTNTPDTTAQPSCRYNCGRYMGSCSCSSSCRYNGNCCHDYNSYCQATTTEPSASPKSTTAQPSCRYNCGRHMGSCSCSSSCRYNGNCCRDYNYHCPTTTPSYVTSAQPSCRYNCGYNMGSCSCSSSCQYYGNCCYDYNSYCQATSSVPVRPTTAQPSCLYNCGSYLGSCSCSSSCRYNGNCCRDYYSYCQVSSPEPVTNTTAQPSCRYNCGSYLGSCSCSSSCRYYGNCCRDYYSYCQATTPEPFRPTTGAGAPCGGTLYGSSGTFYSPNYPNNYTNNARCTWYIRPGRHIIRLWFTSVDLETCCDAITVYDGTSTGSRLLSLFRGPDTPTFYSTGSALTVHFTSDGSVIKSGFRAEYQIVSQGSCEYNCGYQVGSCSCSSSCQYYGNCCYDYHSFCQATTTEPPTAPPSCRHNCGSYLGSCSCSYSCQYNGNCCYDYNYYCPTTTIGTEPTPTQPSCRHNCGSYLGSCSCSSSCRYNGNCCHDYYSYCQATTHVPVGPTTDVPCGGYMYGSSGTLKSPNYPNNYTNNSDCTWYIRPGRQIIRLRFYSVDLENHPECYYDAINVYDGSSTGSRRLGKVCGTNTTTFYSTGSYLTVHFYSDSIISASGFYAEYWIVSQGSCEYNCGYQVGSCSCSSSCQYYGNCCSDYNSYCQANATNTTTTPATTAQPSCRYNCGYNMGSCSCSSSCRYYGNCCSDYYSYCNTTTVRPTTAQPSCRYNCGSYLGSCSCSSSCRYNGNCCRDYYSYCQQTTDMTVPPPVGSCGGSLSGSGSFSSPNYPYYYHDNSYCVWQLKASHDQRIFLAFTFLQLDNCCNCDYIELYDGPSVGSPYLGKVCNNSLTSFYSSSNYMTVVFRTDGAVVARGFNAEYTSSLSPSSGRVDCSSDNMNIVMSRTYLNSLGYDGHNLYLNDQHCRPQVSWNQVVFNFPIDTCGSVRKFENGRVVYTNAIRAYSSDSGEITRQSHFKLNVGCRMEQDSMAQIMYLVSHSENSSITGTGRFNTTMNFYTASNFYYQVNEVPYEVSLNQNMYVQVDLRREDRSLVLFLDTCVTSPSPHDFLTRSYYLVRNGCGVDNTYQTYSSGTRPYARFSFKAFEFLRATESVYIQCKVLICPASDYNSRCRRGCNRRKARDLGSKHDSQTLVLGPIKLKDTEKKEEETQKQDKA